MPRSRHSQFERGGNGVSFRFSIIAMMNILFGEYADEAGEFRTATQRKPGDGERA
jgi:hypothetical protein